MNNKKLKVYVDFDSTIVNSVERFVDIANKKYGTSRNVEELGGYNFKNMYPEIEKEDILEIFAMEEFFDSKLKFMDGAFDVLNKYKEDITFCISTAATGKNLELKTKWINNNIPFIKEIYSSTNNDKSNINMERSIQIDDVADCLKHTNAEIKILYKNFNNFKWQRHNNDNIYNINTWSEIDDILDFYLREGII